MSLIQGTECDCGQTSVKVWKCQGQSKVRKRGGCLRPEGKQEQLWDSVGQPVVEMGKGAGKAGSQQENPSLCALGYSHRLCHQGL